MADESEKIHAEQSGPIKVGVDMATMESNDVASVAAAARTSDGGSGSGGTDAAVFVPKLESFSVYWDVGNKRFKFYEPKVVVGGEELYVDEPEALSRAEYVCVVTMNARNEPYARIVTSTQASMPTYAKALAKVPICRIADGKVEQLHVGAIVVGGDSILGEEGEAANSTPQKVRGDIDFKSANGSGLVTATFQKDNKQIVRIGLKGKGDSDTFAIRTISDSQGNVLAKFLGTSNVVLPSAGEGGGEAISTTTVQIVTQVDIYPEYTDGGLLTGVKADIHTATATVLKVEDEYMTTQDVVECEEVNIVKSTSYDQSSHKFEQNRAKAIVLQAQDIRNDAAKTVFSAVPHSSNT